MLTSKVAVGLIVNVPGAVILSQAVAAVPEASVCNAPLKVRAPVAKLPTANAVPAVPLRPALIVAPAPTETVPPTVPVPPRTVPGFDTVTAEPAGVLPTTRSVPPLT